MKIDKLLLFIIIFVMAGCHEDGNLSQNKATYVSYADDSLHLVEVGYLATIKNDFRIFYTGDSLFRYYKIGASGSYAYYMDEFDGLADSERSSFYQPDTTFCFNTRKAFMHNLMVDERINYIKEALPINQYRKKDSALISDHLIHRLILQMINADKNNLLVLARDTGYYGHLIWYNRISGKKKEIHFNDGLPPESLSMMLVPYDKNKHIYLIINEIFPGEAVGGTFFSYIYRVPFSISGEY